MLNRKRPQSVTVFIRPVEQLVHHHSAGPEHNGFDNPLGRAILMVSSNSTVGDGLTLHLEVVKEFLRLVWMVISAVGLDMDPTCPCEPFKRMLGLESLAHAQGYLV
jgi:hypothetical protein